MKTHKVTAYEGARQSVGGLFEKVKGGVKQLMKNAEEEALESQRSQLSA